MGGLTAIYYASAVIGGGWLILQHVAGLLGGAGHAGETDDPGVDVDHAALGVDASESGVGDADAGHANADHADDYDVTGLHPAAQVPGQAPADADDPRTTSQVSPWKPLVLSSALGAFGVTGTVLTAAALPGAVMTAGLSVASGFGVGWSIWRLLVFAAHAQSNDTESADGFIGLEGRLSLGCSAAHPGEVIFATGRSIQQCTARPFDPEAVLPSGARVIVLQVRDGVAYVEAVAPINVMSPPPAGTRTRDGTQRQGGSAARSGRRQRV